MELIFLGTPAFAVPTLERIVDAGHRVPAVFTQPDRPKGRGGQLNASPVKEAALRLGLPVHQPERIRRPEVMEQLTQMRPDAMVVVGYGQIIPQAIIDIPPRGIINVHASLLPKYRGAAPIQWAIAHGETRTGVTTMRIDAGLDTGDMLLKWETEIGPEENALELGARLAEAGADLLVETLRENPTPVKQDRSRGDTRSDPKEGRRRHRLELACVEDSSIDRAGCCRGRARIASFAGKYFTSGESRVASDGPGGEPGEMIPQKKRLLVACGEGTTLELTRSATGRTQADVRGSIPERAASERA